MQKRRYHDFPEKISCLRVPKKTYRKHSVFQKIRVSKNFMHKRGEGVSRFSVEKLLSHSTETFRRRTLLCFRKSPVSQSLSIREGGYRDFLSIVFCLTVPKDIVGEPFCVSEKFWHRKLLNKRGQARFVDCILCHGTKTFFKGILRCFKKL